MRNILHEAISQQDITAILAAHFGAQLLPPLCDEAWLETFRKPAVKSWMEPIRHLAESERDEPLPELTNALYADFHRTGTRLNFESVYAERRRRLARAAMCALADRESGNSWMPSVESKLTAIFDEVSWAFPAHVNHPSGKDPHTIDLFAAETANLMGEMITLFGEALSASLMSKIKTRLRAQFFENFLSHEFSWMTAGMNWNAVCH